MSKSLQDRIIAFVSRRDYRPQKPRRLARAMDASGSSYHEFRDALRALVEQGALAVTGGGTVAKPTASDSIIGVYRANRRGFGFVIPNAPTPFGDLFIPPGAQADAQDGDTVQCRARQAEHRHGRPVFNGQVVRIVQRGSTRAVGKLQHIGNRWVVQPDGGALREPIQVGDITAKGAGAGDQVVVEILQYPTSIMPGKGVIVERLGPGGKAGIDVLSIIRQHGLPDQFSSAALEDARAAAAAVDIEDELCRRLDLRGELLITIDPPDARDYDDAISLRRLVEPVEDSPVDGATAVADISAASDEEPTIIRLGRTTATRKAAKLANGRKPTKPGRGRKATATAHTLPSEAAESISRRTVRAADGTPRPTVDSEADGAAWELGVHIADVSRYVREGSALDADARERGTSVYFPRHVVPMLPEIISNAVCSLQEGQPRLCKSVFIRFDGRGRPLSARFANTVIQSSCRLTYEQAQAAIDGKAGDVPHAACVLLKRADELARVIRARRLKQGMLVLDLPEIDLLLNENDQVIDASPSDTSFTHTIIEMFMVEANEAAARALTERGVQFLRRVHAAPEARSMESLMRYLRTIGISPARRPSRADLQRILGEVRGKPEARMINLAVLKSMAQAVYAPGNEGHYALASECYCHFTSPIRRYPDLHVHRLLDAHVMQADPPSDAKPARRGRKAGAKRAGHDDETAHAPPTDVASLGRLCSAAERRAQDAERELRLVKIMAYLGRHVGETYEGIITGINTSGLFVQHPKFLVDGLLEVGDLPDDRWQLDESRSQLVGRRTGRRYRLGDALRVMIAHVDLARRRIVLAPAAVDRRKRTR